jgi:hypothetical protein
MTSTVQDKVKTDWQQVQTEGGQRLSRIRDIFKAASSEALGELKAGTNELQTLSRKSLAEMIAQLKETEQTEQTEQSIVFEAEVESDATDLTLAGEPESAAVPTWRQLFIDFWHIANDHKGEWTQQMLARLLIQMDQFDADMTAEYGERYRPFQRLIKVIRALVNGAHNRVSSPTAPSQPVVVEVLHDEPAEPGSSEAAQS